MKPTDARLEELHHGGAAPSPALENLEGMVYYWQEHPEWMESLDPSFYLTHIPTAICQIMDMLFYASAIQYRTGRVKL